MRIRVKEGSIAAGRNVRDVLWPAGARIVRLDHGDLSVVPDGNTLILVGDVLTFTGETTRKEEFIGLLTGTAGELADPPEIKEE